jgi:hypothetical protein
VLLELVVEELFHKGGRFKRGPEDVDPVGFGPLGAMMRRIEGLI